GDRKAVASSLRSIYTAPTVDAAQAALDDFKSSQWGVKYPTAVRTWESAWERFIPFLAFPPALRKIIYTTNAIESLNYQLRKIIKNRGHFPNDQAAVKLLWLAICSIEDKRARERDRLSKDRLAPRTGREVNRLIEGSLTTGWKQALGALVINYPDRLDPYLT
ncbi:MULTISPECIES: transposase, partial [unclassified Rhodococcus (in: high G+C Gram-positive bacteria)]